MKNKTEVLVVGHRNPDTDSICSAIAYAYFKNCLYMDDFIPCRAGEINRETAWVLNRFNLLEPRYVEDVSPQIEDIKIQRVAPINNDATVKEAWRRMRDDDITTLPVLSPEGKLDGLIALKDLAVACMDNLNNETLSKAKTPFYDMARTLKGKIVCGNPSDVMEKGVIRVGAGNAETIGEVVLEGDLVILSDRPEAQKAAIESGASVIVICLNAAISDDILSLAKEKGCAIISTPLEAYQASYLINQSIPISYYLTRTGLTVFRKSDYLEDVVRIMEETPYLNYPVLDDIGSYIGMVSRHNLINHDHKRVILLDHNELSQCVHGCDQADIREIIDHHRVGGLQTLNPIYFRNQPVGSTCTIVYQMYNERHVEIPPEIAGAMCCAILSDTLMLKSPTCTGIDRIAVEKLASVAGIDSQRIGEEMFEASENLDGRSGYDIASQDYKIFNAYGKDFGVGQATYLSPSTIEKAASMVREDLEKVRVATDVPMIFFLLTNISSNSSKVICLGENAEELLIKAFGSGNGSELQGIVSRKKQFVPGIIEAARYLD